MVYAMFGRVREVQNCAVDGSRNEATESSNVHPNYKMMRRTVGPEM
jgi:hypothetical protein